MTSEPNQALSSSTQVRARNAPTPRRSPFLLISLLVLVLDQWTKWMIEARLPYPSSVEIIPGLLNFTHVKNTGVAFGLFAASGGRDNTLILTVLGFLALGLVALYFYQVPRTDRLLLIALALVLGGAVGNLLDRTTSGAVTDFIDFYVGTYHWHTFNIADSAITVGIILMLLGSFLYSPPESEDPKSAADSNG